jgi:hypothetical protein
MRWISAIASTSPGRTRSDEVGREADRGETRAHREQMHATFRVEQHQRDTAVGDAVLAEVPFLHLQLDVGAMHGR